MAMLGFPGFGRGEELPSGDPLLPGDVAAGHVGDAIANRLFSEQRVAMLMGKMEDKASSLVEGMLGAVAAAALRKLEQAGATDTQGLRQAAASGGAATAPAPATSTQPPPATAPPPSEGVSTPQPHQTVSHPLEAFREGRTKVEKMTMGSALKSAASAATAPLASRMSGSHENWQMATNPHTGEREWVHYEHVLDENGEQVMDPATNQWAKQEIERVPESDDRFTSIGRRAQIGAFVAGAARGEMVGAIGTTAARIAGPVGLAYGATQAVGGFLEGQQRAATDYRAAYGDQGTGLFAAQDRAGEWLAGMQGFGTIGGDRARAQFQQASALGLRGERREEAQDFAGEMFKRFGMETSDAMEIVAESVSQGNISLAQFSESITEVSRAAVDAGRNSSEAIKDFVDAQQYISSNLVAGGASVGVAEGLSTMAGQLPKALSDSLGGAKGLAGLLTQQGVSSMAALSGQDPLAAWGAITNPISAGSQAEKTLEQYGEQVTLYMARALGMTPEALKAAIQEATGGETVSVERQAQIIFELAGGQDAGFGILMMVMRQVSAALGVQVEQGQLLNLLFSAAQGAFSAPSTGATGAGSDIKDYSGGVSRGDLLSDLGYGVDSKSGPSGYGIVGGVGQLFASDREGFDAYQKHVGETGKSDPVIEALLRSGSSSKIAAAAGVGSASDARFQIVDNDGKMRRMTLAEAIEGGYEDQLANAGIVPASGRVTNNPQSVSVTLDLSPEARDWVQAETATGTTYPRYGGQ